MSVAKPMRLLILGRGRMGQSVQLTVSRGHEVVGMFGRDHVTEAWPEADVAVDFTALDRLWKCLRPAVDGAFPL